MSLEKGSVTKDLSCWTSCEINHYKVFSHRNRQYRKQDAYNTLIRKQLVLDAFWLF